MIGNLRGSAVILSLGLGLAVGFDECRIKELPVTMPELPVPARAEFDSFSLEGWYAPDWFYDLFRAKPNHPPRRRRHGAPRGHYAKRTLKRR